MPGAPLPGGGGHAPAFDSRVRELVSDLSVVSLHLLLPDDLERDLPPVDRSFGDFRRLGEASGGAGAARAPLSAAWPR